jgi:molecular chaperone GrpE
MLNHDDDDGLGARSGAPDSPAEEAESRGPEDTTTQKKDDLQYQASKAAEHYDRLLRTTADFENFKKRAAREREETRRSAVEGLVLKLLPVLDTFEMAMAAAQQPGATLDNLKSGVAMIQNQLRSALQDSGLEEVNGLGAVFDPSLHDAISQEELAGTPEGKVVKQVRKGYKLRDRLLRPASVVVAKKPATS